jgi:DNA-binding MarR family transcriptional regulator
VYDLSKIFNRSNIRILSLLKKEDGLYIREIAERLDISPFSVHKSIKLFNKMGFIEEKKVKNRKTIYLIRQDPLLIKIISLINISEIIENKNFIKLTKFGKIGIYGSFGSGEDVKESDIDLWFFPLEKISNIELKEITREIEKEFEMEVKLLVLDNSKIHDFMQNDPEFYYRLKLSSIAINGDIFG